MTILDKANQSAPSTSGNGRGVRILDLSGRDDARCIAKQPSGVTTSDLMSRFSSKNKNFAKLLESTRKEMAPLATNSQGRPTITSLRMTVGLTQKDFASKINLQQSNVSQIEQGLRPNITRDTMRRICNALNCDMTTLDEAIENAILMREERIARQEASRSAEVNESARQSA